MKLNKSDKTISSIDSGATSMRSGLLTYALSFSRKIYFPGNFPLNIKARRNPTAFRFRNEHQAVATREKISTANNFGFDSIDLKYSITCSAAQGVSVFLPV